MSPLGMFATIVRSEAQVWAVTNVKVKVWPVDATVPAQYWVAVSAVFVTEQVATEVVFFTMKSSGMPSPSVSVSAASFIW